MVTLQEVFDTISDLVDEEREDAAEEEREACAEVADYVANLKGSTFGAGTAKRAAYEIRALGEK